jgi:hypothetical protein
VDCEFMPRNTGLVDLGCSRCFPSGRNGMIGERYWYAVCQILAG